MSNGQCVISCPPRWWALMAVNCGPYRKMTQGISTHGPIGGPDISTTNYADKRIVQTCRMGNVLFLAHHDGGH